MKIFLVNSKNSTQAIKQCRRINNIEKRDIYKEYSYTQTKLTEDVIKEMICNNNQQ